MTLEREAGGPWSRAGMGSQGTSSVRCSYGPTSSGCDPTGLGAEERAADLATYQRVGERRRRFG